MHSFFHRIILKTQSILVAEIEHDFKIITKIGAEPDTRKWRFYGGDSDESLRLHNKISAGISDACRYFVE